jgi:AcrR family transcriptional regulator
VSQAVPRKKTKARAIAGYRKGEQTRQRILDAALKAFGEASFRAVTTRRICEDADVSLPTLQYYFGDKEGLYIACAEAIVARYRRRTAETARAHLKAVIGALAGFLVGSREAERWTQFVAREMRDPGPAFEILYDNLWRPGVELTTRLIARILGLAVGNRAARIRALLLISSVLAFQPGRSISLRTMHWASIGPKELAMVVSSLQAQIDAIGHIA